MIPDGTVEAIRRALGRDVLATLAALGIKARREGAGWKVLCPAHGERTASCRVDCRGGELVWHCHGCGEGGDAIDLVGAVYGLTTFPEKAERAASVAGVYLDRAEPLPAPAPPPRARPAERAKVYPPERDVHDLLSACTPCRADAEIVAWLHQRGLDPDLVDLHGLALALPREAQVPRWASYKGERDSAVPWNVDGYRLIVPMRDAAGRVASVRARAVRQMAEGMPKALPASGFAAVGLVMADHRAAVMLASATWTAGADRRVVLSEGEVDWLTCTTSWNADGMFRLAVLGIGGKGQWTRELADRIPGGSTVIIRTDQDDAGDRYAEEIAASIGPRCTVLETHPEQRAERRRTRAEREKAKREERRAAARNNA